MLKSSRSHRGTPYLVPFSIEQYSRNYKPINDEGPRSWQLGAENETKEGHAGRRECRKKGMKEEGDEGRRGRRTRSMEDNGLH